MLGASKAIILYKTKALKKVEHSRHRKNNFIKWQAINLYKTEAYNKTYHYFEF